MRIAIVSIRFSPGQMTHLRAYKKLFNMISDEVVMFLAPQYRDFMGEEAGITYTDDISTIIGTKPDIVFSYNIAFQNVKLANTCTKHNIKMLYVLHEPWGSLRDLMLEGKAFSKTVGARILNYMICRRVNKVVLSSDNGVKTYLRYMKHCNKNYGMLPLMMLDEFEPEKHFKREYFSFIGGFSDVHGCNEFIRFMEYALETDKEIKFQVATRTDTAGMFENEILKKAISSNRLIIQSGRTMTTEEINGFYRQSICTWIVYNRSTQSGVLPNALMQGTPVLVNDNGVAKDVVINGENGCFIKMPPHNDQILQSYHYIAQNIQRMEASARKAFMDKYCADSFIDLAREVILS